MKKLIICLVFTIFLVGGVSCFWDKEEEEEGTVRVRNLGASNFTEVYIYTLGSARGSNLVAGNPILPGSSRDFRQKVGYYRVEVCKSGGLSCDWASGDITEDYTWSPGFSF